MAQPQLTLGCAPTPTSQGIPMATVRRERDRGRDGWRLQVYLPTGRRVSCWLGKINRAQANEVQLRVTRLVTAANAGVSPDAETLKWASRLGERVRSRVLAWGLLQPHQIPEAAPALGEWLAKWLLSRQDRKPGTIRNYNHCHGELIKHFGAARRINTITDADAQRWQQWMATDRDPPLAPGTYGKLVKIARTIFGDAIKANLIEANPFSAAAAPSTVLPGRLIFIDRSVIDAVMKKCPDHHWKLIVALARYGGLRVPSEVLALRWEDIDWDRQRFTVRSSKTEHHEGGASRVVPLFPELLPYLEESRGEALMGATYAVTRYRDSTQNLGTTFNGIVTKAGHKPWTKPFVNMRASRRTELEAVHKSHVVDAWMGHSYRVARKHYLMPREEDFLKAIGGVVGGVTETTEAEPTQSKGAVNA